MAGLFPYRLFYTHTYVYIFKIRQKFENRSLWRKPCALPGQVSEGPWLCFGLTLTSPTVSGHSQRPVRHHFPGGSCGVRCANSTNHASELRHCCGESFSLGCLFAQKSPLRENGCFPYLKNRASFLFTEIMRPKQSSKVKLINFSS